uniref:Putative RdRp n=1 Tax=Leveillula taurica associated virga-like virus 1 TaxID=2754865 RepID=A0A7D6F368_9VIRU|nr:putative RdRp [Leveillula taurica associated virga-like virus 1]
MTSYVSFGDDKEILPAPDSSSYNVAAAASLSNVTGDLIDNAVNHVLKEKGLPGPTEHMIRGMLANDSNSAVARAYYHSMLAKPSLSTLDVLGKTELVLPYRFSDDKQLQMLREYAPEFSIKSVQRETHDHPMAAACRLVDRKLVYSRIPPNVSVSDVGGSIIPLVLAGNLGNPVHSCSPIVDRKDPGRDKLNRLRVKQISADPHQREVVRAAARRYLNRDSEAMCDNVVQKCSHKSVAISCIHVYDIPMEDWPGIMSNKGSTLVEGCMLFPQSVYSVTAGEIPYAGARYEINVVKNTFSMGFINSAAWWYSHKLSDYVKYGVDQVLYHASGTYSYKIVERRGDTIYYRILKVALPSEFQPLPVYRVPGVPMVRVNGFPVQRVTGSARDRDLVGILSKHARRCEHLFPAVLWHDMLGHAKECAERGTLTYERMVNYYRTVAPRQSINGVIVAGGTTVEDLNQLVALIVHVALFAYLSVAKTKIETEALTHFEIEDREAYTRGNFVEAMAAMGRTLKSTLSLFVLPLEMCLNLMADKATDRMLATGFDWSFEPEYREVSMRKLIPTLFSSENDNNVVDDPVWFDSAFFNAPAAQIKDALADASTASLVLDCLGDVLPDDFISKLESKVASDEPEETEMVDEDNCDVERGRNNKDFGSVHGLTNALPGSVASIVSEDERFRRYASVQEAIVEAQEESKKSEAACADHFGRMMTSNSPNKKLIADWGEQFGNPDYWWVNDGIVQESVSGLKPEDFIHSALFIPHDYEGKRLLEVTEEKFEGISAGEHVTKVYKKIEANYTGWAYTNDSLMIYNGPAIVESMKASLSKSMDFQVVLMQGPPGCGKTTSIVEKALPSDIVLVPARKAAAETALRLAAKGKEYRSMAVNRVKTVDSYMVNRLVSARVSALKSDRLLADEAFMTREGRWLAAAALLEVSVIYAYGDENQIPHVPRAESASLFIKLQYQLSHHSYLTYRCPAELLACWNSVFDYKVRSTSEVRGEVNMCSTHVGLDVPDGCVMMGMYQADKKLLSAIYSGLSHKVKIMTVHESQGNTYEHVRLHRFDLRKRVDKLSLYDRPPYVLVAMSRSTHTFTYVSPDLDDLVSKWIKKGKDSRRIEACKDVATAGKTLEFL